MLNFILKSEQLPRLHQLANYVKKLETICPLDANQLFVLKDGKLAVYGHGNGSAGSGFIEAFYDVESTDSFSFVMDLSKFIQLLEKTKSSEIQVSINNASQLIFKGKDTSSKFTQVVMMLSDPEVKEIAEAIPMYRSEESNGWKSSVNFNIANARTEMTDAAAALGILNVNNYMKIDVASNTIMTADNVSIINFKAEQPLVDDTARYSELYIHRMLPQLCANVDSFKISCLDGEYYVYAEVPEQGIDFYFAEPPVEYQSPSESEVESMLPGDEHVTVEVTAEAILNMLTEFDGVFDPGSWRYGQIKLTYVPDDSKFQLHYDNMVSCVDSELPFTLVEDTVASKDPFMIQIPTVHLKALKNSLTAQGTFKMKFSKSADEILVPFVGKDLTVNLVKMED